MWNKILIELKTFSLWALASLIDSAFLFIWVFIQYWMNEAINNYKIW